MRKLYEKSKIWFAVVLIVLYVLAFSNADALSEQLGVPKLITVAVGLIISLLLLGFIRRQGLARELGLCKSEASPGRLLCYLPLILISSVNFWCGVQVNFPATETLLYMLSMCFVGLLEEVIFRGFLFRALQKENETMALWVCSLSFGMGHIVNLLTGAPVADTLLQLVYASAIGLCFSAVFLVTGSILPCIASHIFVNATSAFGVTPGFRGQLLLTLVQTVLGFGYGFWLLKHRRQKIKS